MKRILLFLGILSILISCSSSQPYNTASPTGIIEQVIIQNNKVQVKVKFSYTGEYPYDIHYWFTGSDTCKVGQIVKLK